MEVLLYVLNKYYFYNKFQFLLLKFGVYIFGVIIYFNFFYQKFNCFIVQVGYIFIFKEIIVNFNIVQIVKNILENILFI